MKTEIDFIEEDLLDNDILSISDREKFANLKNILVRICVDLCKNETLQFPSLFSRIVFICQKYKASKSLEWQLHNIRVKTSSVRNNKEEHISNNQYKHARKVIDAFINTCYRGQEPNIEIQDDTLNTISNESEYIRAQIKDIDRINKLLICITEKNSTTISIRYGVENINDTFNDSIEYFWVGAQINIINYKINKSKEYIPQEIILEPDYLIDASSLAECFQNYSISHLHYFRRKFESIKNSQHIVLGNLANFFLDELIYSEDPKNINFDDTFLKAFKDKPFEFASCQDLVDNTNFRNFIHKAKSQFSNIQRVISEDLKSNNIDVSSCTLEPSFFCEKYGFQGRLDLFQLSKTQDYAKIIELKSGGVPYPKNNPQKIAINHEVQTAIYRLITKSVFDLDDRQISSFILYSASENKGENLRLVAPYRKLEKEILNLRNLIICTEHRIYTGDIATVESLFNQILNLQNYGKVPDFFANQLSELGLKIENLSDTEKAYFFRFIIFITRELYIQKVGDNYFESNTSVSYLWNTNIEERVETYDTINNLEILDIDDSGNDLKILFRNRSNQEFSNFRDGEICILYPQSSTILKSQILKGSIVNVSQETILLRFRYKQKNKSYFDKSIKWVVEHDKTDQSYISMFRSLFDFISSPQKKRNIILGLEAPNNSLIAGCYQGKNNEYIQKEIIEKAISAEDYFLLVGPPGTGKTSVYAHKLIDYYYNCTDQNILLIAYTNRAVDELCETIHKVFKCQSQECDKYIRIGTELSCDIKYRNNLLQNISKKVTSRAELLNLIKGKRIIIGTLASIMSRPEIFYLKYFHLSIIDEASQILEPQIIGILPKVDKFIMIGDHKQLSTITLQDSNKSKIEENLLNIIKLQDCKESLFERLYRICDSNKWEGAFDTLVYQGRMHDELAKFPNVNFYGNTLKSINTWQKEDLVCEKIEVPTEKDLYTLVVSSKRRYFFDSFQISKSQSDKMNDNEANILINILLSIHNIYINNGENINFCEKIGIITPYRNQIALIKSKIQALNIPEFTNIMVDTVERYQGSQKDIIIFSFCINKYYQLEFFSNLTSDNSVDRKLNVAITRARKQFFVIGNKYILTQNRLYKKFIASFDK